MIDEPTDNRDIELEEYTRLSAKKDGSGAFPHGNNGEPDPPKEDEDFVPRPAQFFVSPHPGH